MSDRCHGLAGIVIAAGESARLGQPKQLVRWQSEALIARAARLALGVCGAGVVIVTGAGHDEAHEALDGLAVRAVYNPRWREGMGASIRQGITVAPADSRGFLLSVVDQPLVTGADLAALAAAWSADPACIAAAHYLGINGVPAIFPATYRDALLALRGDAGARDLLRGDASVTRVHLPNAALDIDSPADLLRLQQGAD